MPLPSILSRPRKTINGFNSDWNAGGGDLPIQYIIDNTKWPINTEDDTNSFSSVVNNSGFAEIVLAGPTYETYQTDDWVKITGSVYSGNFRIRESLSANRFIIDTAFVSTDTGTAQLYYNNYTTLIQVYAGIFYDHPLYYSDAIELIGTIELRPDSNNETLVDIHKYVKRHLESKNDIDQSDWPNDINAWTDFYISFAERYDDAGVETTSAYTDDSLTFIGHAVNGALQLANLYGGNYYEYVADVNASQSAKWLSFFTNAFFSNRRYIDFSILSNDGEFDVDIIQYDINGTELKTDTLSYTGKGRGVYRISPIGLVFEDDTAYFTLQAFSGYTALSETQKVLLEDTCIEPTDPPLAADPITATDGLSAITINWTVNQPDADQQLLFRSTSASGPFSQIASLGVTVATYEDTTAASGTTYYYYVQTWKGGLFVNSAIVSAELIAQELQILGDIEARTAWNAAGFQLDDSSGNGNNMQLASGYACEFISANLDYTTAKNLGNIKSVEFWIKLGTTTESIIDLNGTNHIDVSGGTLDLDGGTSEAYYVNGVAGSTIGTDWTHVVISQATDIAASAMEIGRIAASYGDFQIKDLKFYSTELSSAQAAEAYNNPQQDKPTGATLVAAYLTGQSQVIGDGTIFDTGGNANHLIFNTSSAAVYQAGVDNVVVGRQVVLTDSKLHYQHNDVNSNAQLSDVINRILTTTNAWRFEFKNVFFGGPASGNIGLFGFRQANNDRFIIYYSRSAGLLFCDFFVGGVYISANTNVITPNTLVSSLTVAYSGSRTAAGITFNVDGDTTRFNTGGSGTIANTTLAWSALPRIGSRGNGGDAFNGFIPQVDIYDAVSAGNLIHSFSDDNEYNDSVGALTATLTNLGAKTVFTEDQGNAGNDVLGVAVDLAYFDKLLNFNTPVAGANKTTALNIGNVKTLLFLFRTADKDTNVTIAETGTGNTIALSSGAIAAPDFDNIKVDVSTNSIAANDTWYFVSMTSTTDVNLSAFAFDQNFTNGYIVGIEAYAGELSDANLTTRETALRAYLP